MASPLVSTQFANLRHWSFVYLTHLGISVFNALLQIGVFRFRSQEGECQQLAFPLVVLC